MGLGMLQFSQLNCVSLVILLLFLLLVNSSDVNLEDKGDLNVINPLVANENGTNNTYEVKGIANLKKEEQIESSKEVIEKNVMNRNDSKPIKSKEDMDKETSEISSSSGLQGENESGSNEGSKSKEGEIKVRIEESSGSSLGVEKEKLRDEECDPSYMCVDEKKNLKACLRVPGNDSPDLSLLIQNKGKRPVNVTIIAPDFVQLEEAKVELQGKEDKKVKVSITAYKGMDSVILLASKDSHCKLDFKELIKHDSRVEESRRYAFSMRYLGNFTRSHLIIFLAVTAFLLLGCVWAYLGSQRELFFGDGYKAIDMELPVTKPAVVKTTVSGTKISWDDSWDDEEAPMTPALPVTPNLSSRGLASRRLSKEAWKD